MMRLSMALAFAALGVALGAETAEKTQLPPEVPPPPTKAEVNKYIEQLKAARAKADSSRWAQIDLGISQLEMYRRNGLDAEKTLKEQSKNRTRSKSSRAPGGKVTPPLKGGIYQPNKAK